MEARKIYVICTSDQSQHTIMSTAETLGQLKADLDAAHINYNNMSFLEGRSKTELRSDESVLPHNVPTRDGGTTNELVFMLTNMKKKIESGASRSQIYTIIVDEDLAEEIKNFFGRNYTNVSTADLEGFLNKKHSESKSGKPCNMIEGLKNLIETLFNEDEISEDAYDSLYNYIEKYTGEAPDRLSQEEIDDMFDFTE